MNIAVLTIGKRDIAFDGKNINDGVEENFPELKDNFSVRTWGKYLYDNYDQCKDKLKMPIIMPFLKYLSQIEVELDKIAIVVTDQSENVPKFYRGNDTIFFAEIIKKLLMERKICKEYKIIKIKNNVADMDSVYEEFKRHITSNRFFTSIPPDTNFYILTSGGIPVIVYSLLLNLIVKYRENVHQYRVDEESGNVIPIGFNKSFLREFEKNTILSLLERYLFASIKKLSSDEFIKLLAEYAYKRLSFDFTGAAKTIDEILEKSEYRNLIRDINSDHWALFDNNEKKKLEELFLSAKIKIIQEQYADAITRLYNFADNLSLNIIEKYLCLDISSAGNFEDRWVKCIRKLKNEKPDLKEFEKNYKTLNGNPLNLEKYGLPSYKFLIEYFNKNGEFNPLIEILDPLIKISKLRNKSIGAHGFEGVSKNSIDNNLKQFDMDLDALLSNIEKYLNISFENSVYRKIRNLIEERL
jgi:hypothetical protein